MVEEGKCSLGAEEKAVWRDLMRDVWADSRECDCGEEVC